MIHNKQVMSIFLCIVACVGSVHGMSRKRKVDPKNIDEQIALENLLKENIGSSFSSEQITLLSNKMNAFSSLIHNQRNTLGLTEFNTSHIAALEDLEKTFRNSFSYLLDLGFKDAESQLVTIFTGIDMSTERITGELKKMPVNYTLVRQYREATETTPKRKASLKTRVKKFFKKEENAGVITSPMQDKEMVKKQVGPVLDEIEAIGRRVNELRTSLVTIKTTSDTEQYTVQLMTKYIDNVLVPIIQYCIKDLTI